MSMDNRSFSRTWAKASRLVPVLGRRYLIPMSLIQNVAAANVPCAGRPAGEFPICVSG
jgi:hypothetical protein